MLIALVDNVSNQGKMDKNNGSQSIILNCTPTGWVVTKGDKKYLVNDIILEEIFPFWLPILEEDYHPFYDKIKDHNTCIFPVYKLIYQGLNSGSPYWIRKAMNWLSNIKASYPDYIKSSLEIIKSDIQLPQDIRHQAKKCYFTNGRLQLTPNVLNQPIEMMKNKLSPSQHVAFCLEVIQLFSNYQNSPFDLNRIYDLSDEKNWINAREVFLDVRIETNKTTERREESFLCMLENGCKVIYNAGLPSHPFDQDSLSWFVHCARLLSEDIGSDRLNVDFRLLLKKFSFD